MKTPKPVTLGCVARDQITGFEGVVIADTLHLNGCRRFFIQSQTLKDKKTVEESFDALNVEYVKEGPIKPPLTVMHVPTEAPGAPEKKRPGGPFPSPTRAKDPTAR